MPSAPPTVFRRTVGLTVVLAAATAGTTGGCQGPDAYYRHGRDGAAGDAVGEIVVDGGLNRALDGSRGDAGGGTADRSARPDVRADDAGGSIVPCASCKLVALYACSGPDANQIRASFKVANRSGESLPLSDVTFRYWFADIAQVAQEFTCDYAVIATENITHDFVPVIPARPGADQYVEIGFTQGAGRLGPFGDTGEIRVRISRNDQQTITQSDDYSFDCSKMTFTEWNRITVYERGVLVGGIEPPARGDPMP